MEYNIRKTNLKDITLNSNEWEKAETIKIDSANWSDFTYCPETFVKVLAGDEGFFVKFKTDEENLIMECDEVNGPVYKDSCVEFFFNPDPVNSDGYFNFEINAKGTILVGYGTGRSPLRSRLPEIDKSIFKIESKIEEKGFLLKLYIPYSFVLERAQGAQKIGDYIMGNFQKCKESGVNPHFVSAFPIISEKPDFHHPECFGKMAIEK
ncbi:MAG: hypothetical protein E7405_01430 [Ruminococcaceae bacterium]|nr:hypothetical protein [Oscillospiraceae bacterium]